MDLLAVTLSNSSSFTSICQGLSPRVHHDVAGADRLGSTVVIHIMLASGIFPPNADTEGIERSISSPQHEVVDVAVGICCPIDQTCAFELGVGASLVDHQPLVVLRGKCQLSQIELEGGCSGRDVGASLVFGDKAEGRFARQGFIWLLGSGERVDPAAAGDEPSARVINDHHHRLHVRSGIIICGAHPDDIHPCGAVNMAGSK